MISIEACLQISAKMVEGEQDPVLSLIGAEADQGTSQWCGGEECDVVFGAVGQVAVVQHFEGTLGVGGGTRYLNLEGGEEVVSLTTSPRLTKAVGQIGR